MTPAQEQAMKQAEALAEAEAAAASSAPDPTGGGVQDPGEFTGAVKGFGRGVGRFFASLPDLPEVAYTGAVNLPRRIANNASAVADNTRRYGEGFAPAPAPPPSGPSSAGPLALDEPYTPVSDAYNAAFPPDPKHPYAETFGSLAAPAIVEAALTGGTSLLALPASLRAAAAPRLAASSALRATETSAGTAAGGKVGEEIDKALGGSGETGNFLGSTFTGGVGPNLTVQGTKKYLAGRLTDAASPARLQSYDVMRGAGTPNALPDAVSLGLVGSKRAGQIEDATAGIPFAGNRAYEARAAQHEQMDAAAKAAAEIPRGGPSSGNLTPSAMGQNVMDTAEVAHANAQAAKQAAFAPMKAQIGPDTVLPSKTLSDALDRLSRGATVGVDKPTYDYFSNLVSANARAPLESGAPKVVDPALEASLQAQLARAQANLASAKPGSPLHTASSQSVADLTDAIDANRNPTYENLIKLRTKSANPLDSAENFNYSAHLGVKKELTAAQKEVAASKGVSSAEFDAANAEYGRLKAQQDFFDKLRDKTGQGEAYSAMMSGQGRHNADQIAALAEHAPAQTSRLLADELELKLRGQRNAGGPPGPEGIAPQTKTAPNWFSGLPDQARGIMSGGPPSAFPKSRLNALLQTMEADARRPTRTIPGAGGNTLGLASIFKQATVPTAVATYLTGPVGGAITAPFAALGPTIKAQIASRALTSPRFTRAIVGARNEPLLNDRNTLARLMAAAYGGQQ